MVWTASRNPPPSTVFDELRTVYQSKLFEIIHNRRSCGLVEESFVVEFNNFISDFESSQLENRADTSPFRSLNSSPTVVLRRQSPVMFRKQMRSLNNEQRLFVDNFVYLLSRHSLPVYIFIDGPGGAGKSYLIEALLEYSTLCWSRLNRSGCDDIHFTIKVAPTGVASVNIGGWTLHSAFNIPVIDENSSHRNLFAELERLLSDRFCYLHHLKLLIIDEISAVSSTHLMEINRRLQYLNNSNLPFGGISVIVLGDFFQLSPPKGIMVNAGNAPCANLWSLFSRYQLIENMRQRQDSQFYDALLQVRSSIPTVESKLLLENCVIDAIEYDRLLRSHPFDDDVLFLIYTNLGVKSVNNSRINWDTGTLLHPSIDTVINSTADSTLIVELFNSLPSPDYPFPTHQLLLRVNTIYFLTQNLDPIDGLVCGTPLLLRHIEYSPTGSISRLWMSCKDTTVGLFSHQRCSYIPPHLDRSLCIFPICTTATETMFRSWRIRRIQYTLILTRLYPANDSIPGTDPHQEQQILEDVRLHNFKSTQILPHLLPLQIGFPYMLQYNIDVSDGLVNGANLTLQYIQEADAFVTKELVLWMSSTKNEVGSKSRMNCKNVPEYVLSETTWFPIRMKLCYVQYQQWSIHRYQFPLQPFGACTIHKSQSATLNKVLVITKVNNSWVDSTLFYVAISRVCSRDKLMIYPGLPKLTSLSGQQNKVRAAIHRMPNFTVCLPRPSPLSCNIGFHNIQGLSRKYEDYETDPVLDNLHLFGVAECQHPIQNEKIKQLRLIGEISGNGRLGHGLAVFVNPKYVSCHLTWSSSSLNQYSDIESLGLLVSSLKTPTEPTVIYFVYARPTCSSLDLFSLMQRIIQDNQAYPVAILGDLNDVLTNSHREILHDQHRIQCRGPDMSTHRSGGRLDVVFSNFFMDVNVSPAYYSDHDVIWSTLP